MSEARKLFLESRQQFVAPANLATVETLRKAADLWRKGGLHFSAGVAMSDAVYRAWGKPQLMTELLRGSLEDFGNSVVSSISGSLCWLASVHKLRQQMLTASWMLNPESAQEMKIHARELGMELAESLLLHYRDSEHANNYLVRGVCIATDLDNIWDADFPTYEVPVGSETWGERITINTPSAFHILVDNADWQRAFEITADHPNGFTSAGLRGWRAVVLANVDSAHSVEHLDEAADLFAADRPPTAEELQGRGGSWTSVNAELWSKYFRARARLFEAIRNPEKVKELLTVAADIIGSGQSGWYDGGVARFRVLGGSHLRSKRRRHICHDIYQRGGSGDPRISNRPCQRNHEGWHRESS